MHEIYIGDSEDRVTPLGAMNGTRFVPANTILILVRGMMLKRRIPVGITTKSVTFNQDVKALIPKAGIDPTFLLNWVIGNENRLLDLVEESSHGTGKLPSEVLYNVEVKLPPLPEQRAIAAILSTWDEAITLTTRLIDALKRRKAALMQLLLTGEVRFSEFDGAWESLTLQDLLTIEYGKSPQGIKSEQGNNPIIGTSGIVGWTDEKLSSESAIIIGRKGTIDTPLLVERPFWAIDTTYFCLPRASHDIGWIYYAVQAAELEQYNEASGVPSLSRNTLYSVRILTPHLEEQHEISEVLKACDGEIHVLEQYCSHFMIQKRGLMQQLLTGAVRV